MGLDIFRVLDTQHNVPSHRGVALFLHVFCAYRQVNPCTDEFMTSRGSSLMDSNLTTKTRRQEGPPALSPHSLGPLAPLDALFLQPQVLPGIREESSGSFQGVSEKAVGKQETLQGAGLPSSAPASERFPVPRMTVFRSLC